MVSPEPPHPRPLRAATRISPCSFLQGQSVGTHPQAELSVSHLTEHTVASKGAHHVGWGGSAVQEQGR